MIIVQLQGGMGNQMFQYALGRALSLKNNVSLGLDLNFLEDRTPRDTFLQKRFSKWGTFVFRNYDLGIFNIDAKIVSQKEIPFFYKSFFSGTAMIYADAFRKKFFPGKNIEKSFNYDKDVSLLGSNAYLMGSWQSFKYFDDIEDVIREDFKLKNKISDKSQVLMNEISSCESLCINVRRADFLDNSHHGTIGNEYYNMAISIISQTRKIDKIYVFSDDMAWCEENLSFSYPTMFVNHEYAGKKFEEYLALMIACKNFIIPNSTFGWWAAWLSGEKDKVVIAPKKWFADGSEDGRDLIPENWIRV
jgi:hypothetical protein